MAKYNKHIGFNDKWVSIVLIPLTAFLIPLVFFDCRFYREPYYTKEVFVVTLLITTCTWLSNRYIMILFRKRFANFDVIKKRICLQSITMFLFTILVTNTLNIFIHTYSGIDIPLNDKSLEIDFVFKVNVASLFCTLTAIAIYEGIYFMLEYKKSIEEKENFKRENLKAQLNALQTQISPHFLFNNLNTLTFLIPDNPSHAVNFVKQLSKLYRYILELKDENLISLNTEMKVLHAYIFLLKTRFENNLQVDEKIDISQLNNMVIPLSMQILMENAIKHNIVSALKPLKINIYIEQNNLVMENNLQLKKYDTESTGIGLQNIKNRYQLITNDKIIIDVTNKFFKVSLPLIKVG